MANEILKEILEKIKSCEAHLKEQDAVMDEGLKRIENSLARRIAKKQKPTAEERKFIGNISDLRIIKGGKG